VDLGGLAGGDGNAHGARRERRVDALDGVGAGRELERGDRSGAEVTRAAGDRGPGGGGDGEGARGGRGRGTAGGGGGGGGLGGGGPRGVGAPAGLRLCGSPAGRWRRRCR